MVNKNQSTCARELKANKKKALCPMITALETVTISLKPSLKVNMMNIQGVLYVSIPSRNEAHMHQLFSSRSAGGSVE